MDFHSLLLMIQMMLGTILTDRKIRLGFVSTATRSLKLSAFTSTEREAA